MNCNWPLSEELSKQLDRFNDVHPPPPVEQYGKPFVKTPQVTPPFADSYFPVYTYRYDEHTSILTQYKNGVEYMRMFVPETYELKESL